MWLLLSLGAAEPLQPAHQCCHDVCGVLVPSHTCLFSPLQASHTLPTEEGSLTFTAIA